MWNSVCNVISPPTALIMVESVDGAAWRDVNKEVARWIWENVGATVWINVKSKVNEI
jgi:hypothetical protein